VWAIDALRQHAKPAHARAWIVSSLFFVADLVEVPFENIDHFGFVLPKKAFAQL
jgi:hypothetical protein